MRNFKAIVLIAIMLAALTGTLIGLPTTPATSGTNLGNAQRGSSTTYPGGFPGFANEMYLNRVTLTTDQAVVNSMNLWDDTGATQARLAIYTDQTTTTDTFIDPAAPLWSSTYHTSSTGTFQQSVNNGAYQLLARPGDYKAYGVDFAESSAAIVIDSPAQTISVDIYNRGTAPAGTDDNWGMYVTCTGSSLIGTNQTVAWSAVTQVFQQGHRISQTVNCGKVGETVNLNLRLAAMIPSPLGIPTGTATITTGYVSIAFDNIQLNGAHLGGIGYKIWDSGTFTTTAGSHLNTVDIVSGTPVTVILAAGTYWLAFAYNGTVGPEVGYFPTIGQGWHTSISGMTLPLGSVGGVADNWAWTLYATYNASPTGTTKFFDSGPCAVNMASSGGAYYDSSIYKFGGASAYFNGSLVSTINSQNDVSCATVHQLSSWTVEFWIRYSALGSPTARWQLYGEGLAGNYLVISQYFGSGGLITVDASFSGSGTTLDFPFMPAINTWYNIAIVDSAGHVAVFINGIAEGPAIQFALPTWTDPSAVIYVGGFGSGSSGSLNGWIDELRTSSAARYTANFAPLDKAFFITDSNTLLLMHFDQISQNFNDDSGNSWPILGRGIFQVQTGRLTKFGCGSMYLGGGFLTVTSSGPKALSLDYSTGWTLDTWFMLEYYPAAKGGAFTIWEQYSSSTSWSNFAITGSPGNTKLQLSSSGLTTPITWPLTNLSLDQYYWLGITITNTGSVTAYLNGAQTGQTFSLTSQGTVPTTPGVDVWIGASQALQGGGFYYGIIDEYRISNTVRTLTTIPTSEYPTDAHTMLLLHFNGGVPAITTTTTIYYVLTQNNVTTVTVCGSTVACQTVAASSVVVTVPAMLPNQTADTMLDILMLCILYLLPIAVVLGLLRTMLGLVLGMVLGSILANMAHYMPTWAVALNIMVCLLFMLFRSDTLMGQEKA